MISLAEYWVDDGRKVYSVLERGSAQSSRAGFPFLQGEQEQEKRNQRQNKENGPAAAVDGRVDHGWIDIDTKLANDEDPEAIPQ